MIFASTWLDYGMYDISWYKSTDQVFVISTEKELAGVAYLVNNQYSNFYGKTIKLDTDIDLSGSTWIGIGSANYSFRGSFDGQRHSIKGVYITEDSGQYPYYGFWNYMQYGTIKDLNFDCNVRLNYYDASMPNTYGGGLAAYASSCTFENCNISVDVTYKRSSTIHTKYKVYLGGMIGSANSVTTTNCIYTGDISVDFGRSGTDSEYFQSSSSMTVDGLIADTNESTIKYCGSQAGYIKVICAGSKNSCTMQTAIGGLIGHTDDRTTIKACYNNTNSIEAVSRGTSTTYMSIGGITSSAIYYSGSAGGLYNCYSTTSNYYVTVQQSNANVRSGGIAGNYESSGTNKYIANFSPSNLVVTTPTRLNLLDGYGGSKIFTSSQMKSDAFLSELNMYPIANGENYTWILDGGYPRIKADGINGINTPTQHKKELSRVYDIQGRHATLDTPGMKIVRREDGKAVKIFVK